MKKITFTTALLASACAFGGFEGHVTSDGYVPGLQQGIFRNGGWANVNFSATCAEADRFSHTLGTILADVNASMPCQARNRLTGAIETWPQWGAVLYDGEMYFEGGLEYNFFGAVLNLIACQLDGSFLLSEGNIKAGQGVTVFSKTFKESGWRPIRVWIADFGGEHGAMSIDGMGFGWNTNGCKVVNASTKFQWSHLLDDGSGRLLRSKVLPQGRAKVGDCGPVGTKDGEVRVFGAQDGLPCEIEMVWIAGRGEVDGFWMNKKRVTQRQWKCVTGYNPIDKDKQDDDAQIGPLDWWDQRIVEFLWALNTRYTGAGRFARISDAQWQLAAKYCTVGFPSEFASLRIAFRPTDKCNSEREAQKLVKRGSDVAFDAMLAKGEGKRYSLADGLDLDMIKVEGCGETFYLGRYEVTQEQYEKVMASNPSIYSGVDNLPVSSVNWRNAMTFCEKLNALVPVEGMTWALPSAKQWAFAANGGLKKRRNSFFGGDDWREVGWWGGDEYGHWYTRPVGLKKPNELGFHDLFGNCWEWCCDGDGRADFKYVGGPGLGLWGVKDLIRSFETGNVNQNNADFGFRVALVPVSQQVSTVVDGEGKETVDGYTWSYRVKNGEAEIVAEKDGKTCCAVSPSPTGEVKIPSTLGGAKVASIGTDALKGCDGIVEVTLPENLRNIGTGAFHSCGELVSVTIPQGVTNIGYGSFHSCGKLESVSLPQGLMSIEREVFVFSKLKKVAIPSSVAKIGSAAFAYCGELEQLNVSEENQTFASVGGVIYTKDMKEVVLCPPGATSVTIPFGVTRIRGAAFVGCGALTSLVIPSSVNFIGDCAFSGCGLASITLPEGLTKIEGATFWGCGNLASITIPKSVTSIGGNAFRWCGKLKSVTIPKGVKDIGGEAFIECGGLESVTMLGERPNAPDKGVFQGCGNLKVIYVPANAKSWKGMREWQGITLVFGEGKKVAAETASAAKKLGQCDFLLNKDFKKNAKFYLCLFSASWCGPCRREMPRIAKMYAETLKDDPDIELIHFSCDRDNDKAMAWAKEHDVKFPVVKPKGGNPLNLHARGIPHLFIVKNDGTMLEEGHPASLFKEEKLRALKR